MPDPTSGLKLFTDLIDAVGKVVDGLKTIAGLPKAEREKYRQVMEEIYTLIDTTLNMVIIRLGDILLLRDDGKFLGEVSKLDNYHEWLEAERQFRLCRSLRVALSEAQRLSGKLSGKLSTRDWDALLDQMRSILQTEGELAVYIGKRFEALAIYANTISTPDKVRERITKFRKALKKEREQLIQQNSVLYTIV